MSLALDLDKFDPKNFEEDRCTTLIKQIKYFEDIFLNATNIRMTIELNYEENDWGFNIVHVSKLKNPKDFFEYVKEAELNENNILSDILAIGYTEDNNQYIAPQPLIHNHHYFNYNIKEVDLVIKVTKKAFVYFELMDLIKDNN